ncbi:MAG TPA: hypothetical protein VFM18_06845 [Methanosarcina sp.]|nr:hypothetical protein [Methanosarcina sp.]
MTKYALQDIKSYVTPSIVRAKKGDRLTVYKVDGQIAYCQNLGGLPFVTTLDRLSDEYVAADPPETKITQPIKRRR